MISAKNGNVIIDISNGNVHEINFAGKTEIPGTDSGQQISNLTLPVELKLWYQDKTDNLFKTLPHGGTLHSGDLYKLVFRTSEDSYVYIFNTDNTGKFVRLFPMKAFKDVAVNNFNPVKADKSCYIPSTEKSFKLDTNTGTGKIFYFAVKNPDPKLENTDFEQGESAEVLNYLKSVCRDCISVITFTHK